jgi:hypothetical protein
MATVTLSERERAALVADSANDPSLAGLSAGAVILGAEIVAEKVVGDALNDLRNGDPALIQAVREAARVYGRYVEAVAG